MNLSRTRQAGETVENIEINGTYLNARGQLLGVRTRSDISLAFDNASYPCPRHGSSRLGWRWGLWRLAMQFQDSHPDVLNADS
jgi:hypothetical protein